MGKIVGIGLTILLAIVSTMRVASQDRCPLIEKIETKLKFGEDRKGKSAPMVKAWSYGKLATIVLVPGVNVNPDGSPRAYSVGNLGLVDIQNGVKILDKDPKTDKPTYLDFRDYSAAYGKPFTALWLDAERNGFRPGTRQFNAFALYSGKEPSIVGNGRGSPQTQQIGGLTYYISMTKFGQSCTVGEQRCFLDSGLISAYVVPGLPKKPKPIDPLTTRLGSRQLAWAYHSATNLSTFAIGGDTGPSGKFGEATIAFQQLLRFGQVYPIPNFRSDAEYKTCANRTPPSIQTDCLYPGFAKQGEAGRIKAVSLEGDTLFVFFDRSYRVLESTVTANMVQERGKAQMENIGGLARLSTCMKNIPELRDLVKKLN